MLLWFVVGIIVTGIFLFVSYTDNEYITLTDLMLAFFIFLGGPISLSVLLMGVFLSRPDIIIFGKKKDD